MIDDKTFNTVAQSAHFFSGLAVILVAALFTHGMGLKLLWVTLAAIALELLKEFWYDAKYEIDEVRGNSWEDTLVTFGGVGVAWLLLLVSSRIIG